MDANNDDDPVVPREVVKTGDSDVVIQNFDVDYEEDEPDLKLMGGIRGIRALRVQRDYMKDVDLK